jgi:hypothetical protein
MANNELTRERDFFVKMETLMQYEEFSQFIALRSPDGFRIIDFIQFAFNIHSPLAQKCDDVVQRASEAYKLADLDLNAFYCNHLLNIGESNIVVFQGMANEESKFLMMIDDMISCYLSKIQNNNKWEMLVTYQLLFWEYTKRLRIPISSLVDEDKALKGMDIKTKITQPAFDLIKQIDQLKKDLFGDNKRLAVVAEVKIRKTTPETMAISATKR